MESHTESLLSRGGFQPGPGSLNFTEGNPGAVAFSIGASSVGTAEHVVAKEGQDTEGGKTGFWGACFLLMNAILGSGLLGQAFAASQAGIGLFTASLLAMAGCALYAIVLLLLCCELKGVTAYEMVGLAAWGPAGRTTAAVVVTLQNFGAMSGYLVILKDLLPALVSEASGHHDGHAAWWGQPIVLVVGVVLIVVWPLTWLPDIGRLSITSGFSILVMLLFTGVVVAKQATVDCATAIAKLDLHDAPTCAVRGAIFDVGYAEVFPTLAFSFVCHTALLPIYSEMRVRTVPAMMKVSITSIAVCFALYLTAGIAGYMAFRGATQGDLLKQFAGYSPDDPLILACRILVAASVTLTIPLINYPARKAMTQVFWPETHTTFSWVRHIGVGTATLALVTVIALSVPSIKVVFGVVGCTTSVGLVFVLPGLFYLSISRSAGHSGDFTGHRLGALMMVIGGTLVGAASLAGVLYKLVE